MYLAVRTDHPHNDTPKDNIFSHSSASSAETLSNDFLTETEHPYGDVLYTSRDPFSVLLDQSRDIFDSSTDQAVREVMDDLIVEFATVSSCEDVDVCKFYLEQSNMDVNTALLCFFNDQ